MSLKLIIGDKNLSSWSLRPWVLMRHLDIPFEEQLVVLDRPESRPNLRKISPSGLVPCLKDEDFDIWDSLAIMEYLAEKFPEMQLWPVETKARARARSLAAEMHSGFANLRTLWPMDFVNENLNIRLALPVERDLNRVVHLWAGALNDFGREATGDNAGPFLFGRFSIADAMYAPVVSRIKTYGPIEMPEDVEQWCKTIWQLPAMKEWGEGARKEVAALTKPCISGKSL